MFASLVDRVVHFKIRGKIDQQLVDRVRYAIQDLRFLRPRLIAVSINSEGGSLVQAKTLAATFARWSTNSGAPVYTFAEDYVFGSALLVLTAGNKCFGSQFTVMGDIGYVHRAYGLQKFKEDWHYDQKFIYAGENKVRLNPYEDLKAEDSEWIQTLLQKREDQLKTEILKNRMDQFLDCNERITDLEQTLFQQTVFNSRHAVEIGLIDEITSFDEVHHERFHGMKVKQMLGMGVVTQLRKAWANP